MTLALLLCMFAILQEIEVQQDAADPLHSFVVLEVSPSGRSIDWTVDFEGTLHVWAASQAADPRIEVARQDPGDEDSEDSPSDIAAKDDNSGGGTTAYLKLEVRCEETLTLTVSCQESQATVELHWIAAPESLATDAAVERMKEDLLAVEALRKQSQLEEARTLLDAALERLLVVEGAAQSFNVGEIAYKVGGVASDLAALPTADRGLTAAHASRIRRLPKDHPDLLRAKQNLAITRKELGDLPGALELDEYVHAAQERLLPKDHPDLLTAKLNLASTRKELGDLPGACELFEYVHAARERLLPKDHPDLLTAKLNLASTRGVLGDLPGALELDEYVHAARERLLPKDHPDLLTAKLNLASTREALGDLPGALELDEYVHAAWERLLPKDHPDLLRAKQNLAITRMNLGDLPGARELFEYVHANWERLLPKDHPDLLRAKQNLASTLHDLGDLPGARELFEYVHAARERLLPKDHPDLLTAKLNLASTRGVLGDLPGALELDEYVHAAWERLLPTDHPDLLTAKLNLAGTLHDLGDLPGARELFEYVHAAWERLLPKDHPALLTAKQNLAITRRHLGDLPGALELVEYVHTARERLLPKDHPVLLDSKESLAATCMELGDDEGFRSISESLLASLLSRTVSLATESPRTARAAAADELQRVSFLLFGTGVLESAGKAGFNEPLFGVLESLRQVSTSSIELAREAARRPELSELRGKLTLARRELADQSQAAPEKSEEMEAWRSSLVRLAQERDRLQREMRQALEQVGVRTELPTAELVARGLPIEGAWISYLRYRRYFEKDSKSGVVPPSIESLLAFVVTPDKSVRRVELGPVDEISDLIERWRRFAGMDHPGLLEAGARLRERLLDPCIGAAQAPNLRTLHLVLDDVLHLVPFDALPLADGHLAGEAFDLHVETSAQRLIVAPPASIETGTLIAFGGVDYDAEGLEAPKLPVFAATPPCFFSGDRSSSEPGFRPLPHSEEEVNAMGALYSKHLGEAPLLRTKAEASKKSLVELAPSARYLHIATHGWAVPESQALSMLDCMATERSLDSFKAIVGRTRDSVVGFLPETLCGIALAGANCGKDANGRMTGILTAEELATLDLSNCELAVLSGCETNVGIRRAGQGIQSLQSALHTAGARTAITSLWKVPDLATRKLMEHFYTGLWNDKLGKSRALWQAKMALRAEGHAHEDWAGWVLTGDPN